MRGTGHEVEREEEEGRDHMGNTAGLKVQSRTEGVNRKSWSWAVCRFVGLHMLESRLATLSASGSSFRLRMGRFALFSS
jgi:hypothetical protein